MHQIAIRLGHSNRLLVAGDNKTHDLDRLWFKLLRFITSLDIRWHLSKLNYIQNSAVMVWQWPYILKPRKSKCCRHFMNHFWCHLLISRVDLTRTIISCSKTFFKEIFGWFFYMGYLATQCVYSTMTKRRIWSLHTHSDPAKRYCTFNLYNQRSWSSLG